MLVPTRAVVRRLAVTAAVLLVSLVLAGGALADNCINLSRTSAGLSTDPADFSGPYFKGRWLWLPSVGVPLPAWGFEVPENFQNGTADKWLLAGTPYCEAGGILFYNGPRTTEHGVQSGCGAFG